MKFIPAFLIVIIFTSLSHSQTAFLKTIGKNKSDIGYCVISTLDSGFVIGGNIDNSIFNQPDLLIIKINQQGDTLWTKTYSVGNESYLKSIIQTYDSGFICAAFRYNGNYDINLFKLDKNGNLLWEKKYGGSKNEVVNSLTETKDSGLAFCGYTGSFGGGNLNMYVVKTNSSGDSLWTKVFSTDSIENLLSIINTSDNGFLVVGQTWGYGAGEGDALVMKLDAMGNIEWTKTYGGGWDEIFYSICKTSDGNYLLAGNTESWWGGTITDTTVHPPFSKQDFYVVKIKPDGDTLWTKTYGGTIGVGYETANSVIELPDGNYLVGGRASSFISSTDAYLLTLNPKGDIIHSTLIAGSSNDIINGMTARKDGSVILTGSTYSFGSGEEDILIAAIDVNNQAGCYDTAIITTVGNTYTTVLSGFVPVISNGAEIDTNGFIMVDSIKTMTNVCGCSISADISGIDSACIGASVTLKAMGGKYYEWNNGVVADSVSFTITSDTVFSVIVSNDSCSAMISHKVFLKNCTGIGEKSTDKNYEIAVFPNPSSEKVSIFINNKSGIHEEYYLEIFNYLGQKMILKDLQHGQNILDVSTLHPGIFLFRTYLRSNSMEISNVKFLLLK